MQRGGVMWAQRVSRWTDHDMLGIPKTFWSKPNSSASHSRMGAKAARLAALSEETIIPGPAYVIMPTLGSPQMCAATGATAMKTS